MAGKQEEADLIVAGAGGGGLVAAVTAHTLGLRPVVLESSTRLGGATALAAGGIWIPLNDAMHDAGEPDTHASAVRYLLALSDGDGIAETEEVVDAYVSNAAAMVRHLEQHSPLHFEPVLDFPDYRMDLPGARYGRVMTPALFDAKLLGDRLPQTRASIHYPPVGLHELGGAWRAPSVTPDVIGQRMRENIRSGGAAAVAALVRACLDREIPLRLEHRVVKLVVEDGRVVGAVVEHAGERQTLRSRFGVVLATGGADWDERVNRLNLNRPFDRALSPPSDRGDGQRMVARLGIPLALMHESYWVPAYLMPGQEYDGQPVYRPCVADRCSPHSMVVNKRGQRFVDESLPYNDFVRDGAQEWDAETYTYPNLPMFLVVDQQFRERYPLAGVPPSAPTPDWIATAETPRALAEKMGKAAAVMLEVGEDDVELFDGQFRVKGAPQRAVPVMQVVMLMMARTDRLPEGVDGNPAATYVWNPPSNHKLADEQGRAHYSITASPAMHICLLEVDRDTGQVEILRYAMVDDCGVRMNPSVVRGMIHGGLAQGIGCALLEEFVYDGSGQLLTSTYMDYVMPSIMEVPHAEEYEMCTPSPVTALGVKGIGEAAIHTTPAAVLCAVNDALAPVGAKVTESPATPIRIWRALHGERKAV